MTGALVVVATHRRPASLRRLLDALGRQTVPRDSFRVAVVNDGSHDAGYDAALEGREPSVTYLRLRRRAGPAAARNAGVRASRDPLLVFTDDDCVPPPGWLAGALRAFGRPEAPDVLGGPVRPLGEPPWGVLDEYLHGIGFLQPRLTGGKPACIPTANLAVRRSWFERVGGFDERFTSAGGEDLDLVDRLESAGARLAIDRDWTNAHETAASLREFCGRFFRYGYGGALRDRYRGPRDAAASSARRPSEMFWRLAPRRRPWRRRLSSPLLGLLRHSSYELGRLWASL